MTMFYSKSNSGFYNYDVHGDNIPGDAVEISYELYQSLLNGQAAGKLIAGDENGNPYLKDVYPSHAELLQTARTERDRLINYSTLKVNPLQDAVDIGDATEDDIAILKLWKKYRSDVGKAETKPGWPDAPQWPVPPVPLEMMVDPRTT